MADYSNPMQMFQNVDPTPNNPFWSGMMGARNQATAAPFIDMMQQSQGMDLAKKGMETGEFMSPEAQQVRQKEQQAKGGKADFDIESYKQQIRGLGPEMDARIAKAKDITTRLQGSPYQDFLTDLGQMHDTLNDTPEEQRPNVWAGAVQRWQMTHPGLQVPENLRQYTPEHMKDVAAIRFNQLNSPEQVGKERLELMRQDAGMNRETQQQEGATARARIAAEASRYGADKSSDRAQAAETPQKAIARLRRTLARNPKDAESYDEYKSYLDDSWQKEKAQDMTFAMLQIRAMNAQDPAQQEEAVKKMEELRNKYYADRGVYLGAPPDGTVQAGKGGKKYKFDGGFGKNPKDKSNWKEIK